MAITYIPSATTTQTHTDNDTVYILEEGNEINLAAGGFGFVLSGALNSSFIARGDVTATSGPSIGIVLDGASTGASVHVAEGVRVTSSMQPVHLTGTAQTLVNDGRLRSVDPSTYGVTATGASSGIVNTGVIRGGTATGYGGIGIASGSFLSLDNMGKIAGSTAVIISNAVAAEVVNSGRILGAVTGIDLLTVVGGTEIHNDGLIRGGSTGVKLQAPHSTLVNDGTILTQSPGAGAALLGGTGVETVLNSGVFIGDVTLGAGNDWYGASGAGHVDGAVRGGAGNDTITGAAAADRLFGDDGGDIIAGRGGNDRIRGGTGNDDLSGGGDDDRIWGETGTDTLHGGAGNDRLRGGDDSDILFGDGGNDILRGDAGGDTVFGGPGSDTIWGDTGGDFLFGEAGSDTLHGGADNDSLYGFGGHDALFGDAGNDALEGQDGRDVLRGGSGDDVLFGGRGNDRLYGGAGADVFYYKPATADFGTDRIGGFADGQDQIDLTLFLIPNMAVFLGAALSEQNGNARIDLSAINPALYSGIIVLEGIDAADITALDFV